MSFNRFAPRKYFNTGQYKTWTADCGLQTGLGIKRGLGIKHGLNIKCGLSLKIAVMPNKYQKMLLFQFSPALLSRVSFMHGQFYLLPSPPGHTPGDLQFCSHLAVYSPPPGTQKETIPHPRDSSSTTNTLFCIENIDPYNSKTKRFDKNSNAFLEFLERKTLHV